MTLELSAPRVIFENRYDAGSKLAAELSSYAGSSAVVLAIPNGGVPVAMEVAGALKADLDVIISRKIPVPLNPEGGLGAITEDGTIIIDEEMIRKDGITREQIDYEAEKVKASIKERRRRYKGHRPSTRIAGRVAILVDDGLASGITMRAAVESVAHLRPRELVVAVPVARESAISRLRSVSIVVAYAVATMPKFYLADYYGRLRDISDDEVVRLLEKWHTLKFSR